MKYTAIDLFSGAGGFSLGVKNAGINIVAAVDFDAQAAATYRENFSHPFFNADLRTFTPDKMRAEIGCREVDIIFGGPPCQGFSRVKGGNHGTRIVEDDRRQLYRPFLDYVSAFRPKMFVMENVPGLKTAVGGMIFDDIKEQARARGYVVHTELLRAWRFGVPQKRYRLIIAGVRDDISPITDGEWIIPTHADMSGEGGGKKPPVTLWEAIGDLPPLQAGQSKDEYDMARRKQMRAMYGDRYLYGVLEVGKSKVLTGHTARPHMDRDLRDFAVLREGESSAAALRRGATMEFPYDREKFKDRYTKQHRNRLSSTIIAHMSKDGLMFIHPVQRRSLTPREAARIQSFPDRFAFPVTRTHQFRLIGNAVPPRMGQAIAHAIKEHLKTAKKKAAVTAPLLQKAA